jgi:hypothetical protein
MAHLLLSHCRTIRSHQLFVEVPLSVLAVLGSVASEGQNRDDRYGVGLA